MNIVIYTIGKTKENSILELEQNYLKRVKPYAKVEINELGSRASSSEPVPQIILKESESILSKLTGKLSGQLTERDFVIALDERGSDLSSVQFSELLSSKMVGGVSSFTFVIGGAYGLHDKVRSRANAVISLSKMTFPHQLARLFLIEQLYRAFSIMRGEPYHK